MPAYSPASATAPAGTRGRGAAIRGTAHSSRRPLRYAKPGAKPEKATRNSVPVNRPTASSGLTPQCPATKARSSPSKVVGTSTRGPGGGAADGSGAQPGSPSATCEGDA